MSVRVDGADPALPPTPALRAVWLLTRLRLKRLANQVTAAYSRRLGRSPRRPSTVRTAAGGKARNGWVLSGVVGLSMCFSFGNIALQGIANLHGFLDGGTRNARVLPRGLLSDALLRGISFEVLLLMFSVILSTVGSRELSQADWDMEWLITLPLKPLTLLWSRIVERAVVNPLSWIMLWPVGTVVAWISGCRWTAPFAGMAAIAPLLLLIAMARTVVDTGLRLSLSPPRLRNLQAVVSVLSIVALFAAVSLGTPAPLQLILDWAARFPAWGTWLPPGLVVRTLNSPTLGAQLTAYLALLGETAGALWLGFALLTHQLRGGVLQAGARESGRGAVRDPARPWSGSSLGIGTVVQRRELKLLTRDRAFLVQTLVLPVIIVGSQMIFQGRFTGVSVGGASNTAVAALAFAIASYTLMMSALQTLNSEGGALWLLFTLPRSLESILAEKARLWATLGLLYPLLIFSVVLLSRGHVDLELVGLAAVVLLGIPIYSFIATALGVYACDPLSQDVRTRVRPTYVYMFVSLAGIYTYAIFLSAWWQRIALIILSGLLAAALWQKARDELPYLLDPAASPPARVSTADGIIAAMVFFVVQGIVLAVGMTASSRVTGRALIVAYVAAGAITFSLFRYNYWRSATTGVPAYFGRSSATAPGWSAAAGWGLLAGSVAAAVGVAYVLFLQTHGLADEALHDSVRGLLTGRWIYVLAIVAAPVFEEFIFRGLIFGGLRRSMPAGTAIVASAAVFAMVHPPVSMIPVFGLGLCAAFAYERGKILLAPMIAHAIYNASVLAFQVYIVKHA